MLTKKNREKAGLDGLGEKKTLKMYQQAIWIHGISARTVVGFQKILQELWLLRFLIPSNSESKEKGKKYMKATKSVSVAIALECIR